MGISLSFLEPIPENVYIPVFVGGEQQWSRSAKGDPNVVDFNHIYRR